MFPLSPPHPGFFQIMANRQAYTTLLYLLLTLATGIFTFTFAVTGISLSLGLAILIIGIPVLLLFLLGCRLLSVAEVRLLGALVSGESSKSPALLPNGESWVARLKTLVRDRRTWTSLVYFLALMPLGIAYFTTLVSLLAACLGLLAVPVAHLLHLSGSLDLGLVGAGWVVLHPHFTAILCGLAGLALVPLTFHLALLLGRFQVWLARHLLVQN
jgi:Putative sensor